MLWNGMQGDNRLEALLNPGGVAGRMLNKLDFENVLGEEAADKDAVVVDGLVEHKDGLLFFGYKALTKQPCGATSKCKQCAFDAASINV